MKRISLIFLTVFTVFMVKAQTKVSTPKILIGLSGGFGKNNVVSTPEWIGQGSSFDGNGFYAIDASVVFPVKKWLSIETGLFYSHHKFTGHGAPGLNIPDYKTTASILSIPAIAEIHFLKYFFVSPGLLADIDVGTNSQVGSQSGLGWMLGIGAQYTTPSGICFFVNPNMQVHNGIHFSRDKYYEMVYQQEWRIGIRYALK